MWPYGCALEHWASILNDVVMNHFMFILCFQWDTPSDHDVGRLQGTSWNNSTKSEGNSSRWMDLDGYRHVKKWLSFPWKSIWIMAHDWVKFSVLFDIWIWESCTHHWSTNQKLCYWSWHPRPIRSCVTGNDIHDRTAAITVRCVSSFTSLQWLIVMNASQSVMRDSGQTRPISTNHQAEHSLPPRNVSHINLDSIIYCCKLTSSLLAYYRWKYCIILALGSEQDLNWAQHDRFIIWLLVFSSESRLIASTRMILHKHIEILCGAVS